jgi:hypothetical protein
VAITFTFECLLNFSKIFYIFVTLFVVKGLRSRPLSLIINTAHNKADTAKLDNILIPDLVIHLLIRLLVLDRGNYQINFLPAVPIIRVLQAEASLDVDQFE